MRRIFDPETVEDALNRPEVIPLVDGFDAASWLSDRRNVALADDRGNIALFEYSGPGAFEGHTLFASRGREAIDIGRDMVAALFDLWGATVIWGKTPLDRRHARWFTRQLGFRSLGIVETVRGPCEMFFRRRRN